MKPKYEQLKQDILFEQGQLDVVVRKKQLAEFMGKI